MKNILLFIFSLLLISSCFQKNNSEQKPQVSDLNITFDTRKSPSNSIFHLFGDTLIGLEIVNPDESDPYKKYGFEFNGHCYDCDLADILITIDGVSLINSCGTDDRLDFEKRMIQNSGDQIVISTEKVKFIFEKIEKGRIYHLTIEGDAEQHKNLRLTEYYTPKSELFKFEIHDCGEFDG